LSGLDWLVLVVYLGAAAGLGLALAGRNRSYHQFMFGGGSLPWLAVGVSLIATSVSATTFLGNPADSFGRNMTYLMCNLGALGGIAVVGIVFIPRFRRAEVQSAYELLERRFNRPVRRLAAGIYCLHLLLRTGILLYGPALVLGKMLGIGIYTAIGLTSVLAILYTWFGGIRAVVWTDVMQFVVLMGGGLLVLWLIGRDVGSFAEVARLAGEAGKTKWLDLGLSPANARTLLSAGIIYTVFEVAIRGCDQQFIQRYLSCRSVRAANASSALSAVLGFAVALVFFWIGAALYVYYVSRGLGQLPEGAGANDVFPHFILHELPDGLTGLLAAAIFAAAMSSLDSAITALSNTAVVDFSRGGAGTPSVRTARAWVLVWGVLGTGAAFLAAAGSKSLLGKALFFTSLFTGPLLGMFLLAFFRPRTRPTAVLVGAVAGMLSLLPFVKIPVLDWWKPVYAVSWPWNPLITLAATLLVAVLVDTAMRMGRKAE
jgi:SSS family solute:Na+ symporter